MTQHELDLMHSRIAALMDHTMTLHADSAAMRSSAGDYWQPAIYAIGVMSAGAVWGIGCVLLVRAFF